MQESHRYDFLVNIKILLLKQESRICIKFELISLIKYWSILIITWNLYQNMTFWFIFLWQKIFIRQNVSYDLLAFTCWINFFKYPLVNFAVLMIYILKKNILLFSLLTWNRLKRLLTNAKFWPTFHDFLHSVVHVFDDISSQTTDAFCSLHQSWWCINTTCEYNFQAQYTNLPMWVDAGWFCPDLLS